MRDGKRRKLGGIQVKVCMEANNRGNLQNAITCLDHQTGVQYPEAQVHKYSSLHKS